MNINNWFYLIDKPLWISSFDVIRQIRKKINIKKIWHTGTLDPLATGLLIVALWNYTKLIPYFEKDLKTYEFKIMLDWKTPTFDLEYSPEKIDDELFLKYKKDLTIEKIKTILENNFIWDIVQIPPKYSAIKIWWKKALDMARNWEDFEMKKRSVKIHNIEILNYKYPELFLKATVSAWTYIRSIANDLWEITWSWWYISYLRRTHIRNIDVNDSLNIDNFEISKKYDINKLFPWYNFYQLNDEKILSDLNNWKDIENFLKIELWWEVFITDKYENIIFILKSKWDYLHPERKI